MKNLISTFLLCCTLAGCGGGSGGGGTNPPAPVFPASTNGNMTIVSLSGEIFTNLSTLAAQPDIPVTATNVDGNIKITANGITPEFLQASAILSKHPNGTEKGEICMYRRPETTVITGTGEINLRVSGVIQGDYVIRECNVKLAIDATNTEWDAITTQVFGSAEAAAVFFDKVLISKHIVEDTSLLYVGSFAADIVNSFTTELLKLPVLVNESRGIVCMNINPIPTLETYVSYFTPKVVVDPNPPAGYTTAGLTDVNRPVAYATNCTFDLAVWQGIWNNS